MQLKQDLKKIIEAKKRKGDFSTKEIFHEAGLTKSTFNRTIGAEGACGVHNVRAIVRACLTLLNIDPSDIDFDNTSLILNKIAAAKRVL